jgi:ABC-type polysaccharide/polyol phosphate export permease
MMGVLTFVFTQIFPNPGIPNFAVFVLCGLVPYNFFALALLSGTTSIVDSAGLIKRIPVPRMVMPISAVLSTTIHLAVQFGLLALISSLLGIRPNTQWLWLPLIWSLQIVFLCGLCLITASLHVYVRDTRYVVESFNTVMFWLVPIFYPFSIIPQQYSDLYQYNPVAALILALRQIVLDGQAPSSILLSKLALVSFLAVGIGLLVFRRAQSRFYDYI